MSIEAKSATSINVNWSEQSSGTFQYTVEYKPLNTKQKGSTISTIKTSVLIPDLLPNTYYTITVRTSNGNAETRNKHTPKAEAYTEYDYKLLACQVFWVEAGVAPKDGICNDLKSIKGTDLHNLLKSRNYGIYRKYTVSATTTAKDFTNLITIELPNGDMYSKIILSTFFVDSEKNNIRLRTYRLHAKRNL